MSDRSFRDRLARIADNIDLEQLDGLIVNRIEPNYSTEEDQPSLQRLFLGLEDNQSLPPSAVSPPVVMNEVNLKDKKFIKTRIYGHLRWPFFSTFGYGKLLELASICNSLNNSEGMTIFGRNDTNTEGMTIIRKE